MAYITKIQLQEILKNAPPGTTPQQLTRTLLNRGNEIEGLSSQTIPTTAPEIIPQESFGKKIFSATLGREGLMAAPITAARGIVAPITQRASESILSSAQEIRNNATKYAQMAAKETDPTRKKHLQELSRQSLNMANELSKTAVSTAEEGKKELLTPKKAIGAELQTGLALSTGLAPKGATITAISSPSILKNVTKTLGGRVATGAVSGFTSAFANGLMKEKTVPQSLKEGAISGTVGAAIPLVAYGFGKAFQGIGSKITTTVIKPSKVDYSDGFKTENVYKYNVGGSLPTSYAKTQEKLTDLSSQLNNKLANAKETVNIKDAYSETIKQLSGDKFKKFGTNEEIKNSIKGLGRELVDVVGNNNDISVPDAQLLKQAAGANGAWVSGIPSKASNADETVYNTFYNILKTKIEEASPTGVKEINKQISELIPIQNAIIRRLPIAARNNAIGLTDTLEILAAIRNPASLPASVLIQLSKSGWFGNLIYRAGQKVSQTAVTPTVVNVTRGILNQ